MTANKRKREDKGKEMEADMEAPQSAAGTSEPPTEETEEVTVHPAIAVKNPIPRARRWMCCGFSFDRPFVLFSTRAIFAFIAAFYSMAMMAYLIIEGSGPEYYISLYFGIFTFVAGFFLGNGAKLKQNDSNAIYVNQ